MIGTKTEEIVLAGDVGGTKTNLGLFAVGPDRPELLAVKSYSSLDAGGLEELIAEFLEGHPHRPTAACFGIAGPVTAGMCVTTNLPWTVCADLIAERFGWKRVSLINDLAATALAVPVLEPSEVSDLNNAAGEQGGTIGLLAPGTGLGVGILANSDGKPILIASEGGHADFAPRNEEEMSLQRYLHRKFGHVSLERILSGPGIVNVYEWLKEERRYEEPSWLAEMMRLIPRPAAITRAAMEQAEPLCVATLDHFISILGAAAGNVALTCTTTGGIYLAGGIPPRILPKLEQGPFMEAFQDKGRFREMLAAIPVRVILNDKAALLGAARHAAG